MAFNVVVILQCPPDVLEVCICRAEQEGESKRFDAEEHLCEVLGCERARGWFAKGGRRGLSDNVAALLLGRLSCSEYPALVNIISFCGLLI